jgi:hypothetical protein
VLELVKGSTSGVFHAYADMNFLHFAALLFAICTVVLVVVSLLTPPQPDATLAGLTFATAGDPATGAPWGPEPSARSRRMDFAFSILLVLAVGAVWLIFRG